VLAQLKVDSADPDWAAQLRTVARDYRQLALAHPHVVPLLVTGPLATPLALRPLGTLRPLEDVPALLIRAGFSGPGALHIYRALPGFLHGHILNSRNSSTTPTRPTTCSASAYTGCRSARSPCCAASPPSSPATTAHRTPTRTRHPPGRAHNDTDSPGEVIRLVARGRVSRAGR
jgi:Tetracyclin repressor-like, C-terminal domain